MQTATRVSTIRFLDDCGYGIQWGTRGAWILCSRRQCILDSARRGRVSLAGNMPEQAWQTRASNWHCRDLRNCQSPTSCNSRELRTHVRVYTGTGVSRKSRNGIEGGSRRERSALSLSRSLSISFSRCRQTWTNRHVNVRGDSEITRPRDPSTQRYGGNPSNSITSATTNENYTPCNPMTSSITVPSLVSGLRISTVGHVPWDWNDFTLQRRSITRLIQSWDITSVENVVKPWGLSKS